MPGSARENDKFVQDFIEKQKQTSPVYTVLDVGAGKGTYSQILREHVDVIEGIEVWEPYIEEFDLENQYDIIYRGDARTELLKMRNGWYDLIVFGDILEHMTKNESLAL